MTLDLAEFGLLAALAGGIRAGTPLFFAALGEVFAERSGVINLGVEGIMLVSAMTAAATGYQTGSAWAGVAAAVIVGVLLGALFGVLTVYIGVDQIAAGLGFLFFGTGLSGLLGAGIVGKQVPGIKGLSVPGLGNLPFLGQVFFAHDLLVYTAYLLVVVGFIAMYKTKWGLFLRAVGDEPEVAAQLGINVRGMRLSTVIVGAALAGLGGAYLSLAYTQLWIEGMVAGRGLIAVALVIFAAWDPVKAAGGAFLFGFISSLQLRLQAAGLGVSSYLLSMAPYLLTIAVLVLASARARATISGAPKALGRPFVPAR